MSVLDRLTGRDETERADGTRAVSAYERAALLSGVVVVAALVRIVDLTEESLWLDETTTIVARTGMPVADVVRVASQTSPHPPLYFVALEGWFGVVGTSPFTARLFSVVVGVGGVLAAYLVGRALFDETTGLVGALFLALSPFHVQYSRDARMYALLTLLTLASFYYFVRLTGDERSRATDVGYAVATTLVLYTHIYGVFVVLAQNVHVAIPWLRRDRTARPAAARWFGLQAVVGLAYLPWLFVLRDDLRALFGGGGGSELLGWLPDPTPRMLLESLLSYAGYLTNYPFAAEDAYSGAIAAVVGLALLALVWAAFLGYPDDSPEYDLREYLRRYRLLALWFAAIALVPYVIADQFVPIYYVRYTVAALPALYLVAGRGVASLSSARLRWALVLVVAVGLLATTGIYHATPTDEDWRGAGNYVDEHAREDALVLVGPPFIDRPVGYYVDRTDVRIAPLEEGRPANETNGAFWVVTSRAHDYDREALDRLNESYETPAVEEFETVRVYRFETGRTGPGGNGSDAAALRVVRDRSTARSPPDRLFEQSRPAVRTADDEHVRRRTARLHHLRVDLDPAAVRTVLGEQA